VCAGVDESGARVWRGQCFGISPAALGARGLADNLRSQLNRMGVEVDDRARSWTATERAQKPGFEDHNGRRDDDEPRGGGRGGGGGRRRGGSPEGGDSAEGGDSPERVDGGKGAAGESEE